MTHHVQKPGIQHDIRINNRGRYVIESRNKSRVKEQLIKYKM